MRRGFTMVELVIVITLLGILVPLIFMLFHLGAADFQKATATVTAAQHRLTAFSLYRLLKLKNLRNSWLHALSCMVQEEEMEGGMILPAVLPPAAVLWT